MKTFILLCLLIPMTSFASELAICTLEADHYSWNSKYEDVFQSTEVVGVTQQHHNGEVVTLSGSHYPVFYDVTFRAYRDMAGSLRVKVDQPGDADSGKVTDGQQLKLSVEDNFNGGKVVYRLTCEML